MARRSRSGSRATAAKVPGGEPEGGLAGRDRPGVPVTDDAVHVDEQGERATGVAPRLRRRARRRRSRRSTPLTNDGESSVENALGQLDGLVDARRRRAGRARTPARRCQPQQGPVDRRHALDRPAPGPAADDVVEQLDVVADALGQRGGVRRGRDRQLGDDRRPGGRPWPRPRRAARGPARAPPGWDGLRQSRRSTLTPWRCTRRSGCRP